MTQVFIVDDHKIFVDGLIDLFEREPAYEVCGVYHTGENVYHQLKDKHVDIVLLDLQVKEISGIDVCEYINQHHPKIKILVLSMFSEESFITRVMQAGAHGYLTKNSGKEELLKAINLVLQGHTYYSNEVTQVIMDSLKGQAHQPQGATLRVPKLSKREKQILQLIVNEYTTADVAAELFISEKTVESHRSNLLAKLQVKNVAGLVRKALEFNLLADN